jgi:hypothetical protein
MSSRKLFEKKAGSYEKLLVVRMLLGVVAMVGKIAELRSGRLISIICRLPTIPNSTENFQGSDIARVTYYSFTGSVQPN